MSVRRLPLLGIVPAVVLAGWALAQEPAGKKYALVVGVQRYSEGSGLRNLDYTEKDAADLAAVLEKQGYKVTVLTRAEAIRQDKDFLRPTAKNIKAHLAALADGRKADDTVLVALTGHGAHLKATDKLYFCPQETDLTDPATLVAIDDVMAQLDEKHCAAANKVLLVDACRNDPADGAAAGPPAELKSSTRPLVPDPPGGTVALLSCSKGQLSHESATYKRGFLFHHVIEGLGGKAATKKGEVTWLSLAGYVTEELPEAVRAEKGPLVRQTPEVLGRSRAMVLARLDAGRPAGGATDRAVRAGGGVRTEAFDWKGERRTRRVMALDLGGQTVEFVEIPKGSFLMGSPDADADATDPEKPRHRVTFTRPLWVAKYPVTRGQFAAFVKAANYTTEAETDGRGGWGYDAAAGRLEGPKPQYTWKNPGWEQTDRHPVVNVTVNDAEAYGAWAAKASGRPVRLLTEAEYEYANRGGTATRYMTGDDVSSLEGYANVTDRSARGKFPDWGWATDFDDGYAFTSPVGSFKANGFGLYDTTGNVWSWCRDWYDDKSYAGDVTDPGPHTGGEQKYRVLRGGSWFSRPRLARAAYRCGEPGRRSGYVGFRVAFLLD